MTTRMYAEIREQPAALRRTIDALLPRVPEIAALGRETGQVLFIARGSSDNAAVYGRYLSEVAAGRLATSASPSVATAYRSRLDLSGVLAVALSQSGRTEEIVETLTWARDCGARTLAVTNEAGSPLAELAELALVTEAGAERAVPATKTYTAQLAAMAVIAMGLGARRAETAGSAATGGAEPTGGAGAAARAASPADGPGAFADELKRAPDEFERLLRDVEAGGVAEEIADRLAGRLAGCRGPVISGRGFAYSTALELALKFKEACYLPAIGLSYADLLHGPIAVVDDRAPALLVSPDRGPMVGGMRALAGRVTDAGACAYALGGGAELAAACSRALPGPALAECLAPVALAAPGQLLAEALARRLGIDPDTPRGLGKVTQTTPTR